MPELRIGFGGKKRKGEPKYRRRSGKEQLDRLRYKFLRKLEKERPEMFERVMLSQLEKAGLAPRSEEDERGGPVDQLMEVRDLLAAAREIGETVNPGQPPQNTHGLLAELARIFAPVIPHVLAAMQAQQQGQAAPGITVQPQLAPSLPPAAPAPSLAPPPAPPPQPSPVAEASAQTSDEGTQGHGETGIRGEGEMPGGLAEVEQIIARLTPLLEMAPLEAARRFLELLDEEIERNPAAERLYEITNAPSWLVLPHLRSYRAHPTIGPLAVRLDTPEGQQWFERFWQGIQTLLDASAELEAMPPEGSERNGPKE